MLPARPVLSVGRNRKERVAHEDAVCICTPACADREKDVDLRFALLVVLNVEGYVLTIVTSLEHALIMAAQEPFDLVLTQLYAGRDHTSLTPRTSCAGASSPHPQAC
jgi:hypothetical protein